MSDEIKTTFQLYSSVHVLLGDGSRFRERLDDSGVVRFHDPAIAGPQDVSVVMVQSTGEVKVKTYLALDGTEVWLPSFVGFLSALPWTKQGTVTGRVTGATHVGNLSVTAVGKGLSGVTTLAEDGSFSIDVRGDEPGQVDLFARETEGPDGKVLRVGLARGIAVSSGTTVSGLELALDHPVDQSLNVTVEGSRYQGSSVSAELWYILGGQLLFRTNASGTIPLSVPAIARTAPFDTITPMLHVTSGDTTNLQGGAVQTNMPVSDTSSAEVSFLAPLSITSPAVGTLEAPGSASRSGLVLRWNPDSSAHLTEVELAALVGPGSLDWTVVAPASITSFTPFPLPAGIAPVTTFPAGSYRVWATTTWRAKASSYADFFTGSPTRDPYEETRTTRLLTYVELQ
ncbi:hypothetical protein JRI60_36385 [Archangium violaceum]|uniref:hypothetical protein n=1 Tax=Archangium violaceum TaxID=83451 RepID=UPI0019501C05|nr:hypothetical protein [Archangium violaceum]QRN94567.1 hypothetical protein JRI60_36385 [Archangium violaceum]